MKSLNFLRKPMRYSPVIFGNPAFSLMVGSRLDSVPWGEGVVFNFCLNTEKSSAATITTAATAPTMMKRVLYDDTGRDVGKGDNVGEGDGEGVPKA